ncbi:phospholipase effector Tle1 domain-containing protein [Buttiauxella agrestis]
MVGFSHGAYTARMLAEMIVDSRLTQPRQAAFKRAQ